MLEKRIFDTLFKRINAGSLTVKYWDGASVTYGQGQPSAKVHFKTAKAGRAILRNQSLGFGEGYANGDIPATGDQLLDILRVISANSAAFSKFSLRKFTTRRERNTKNRQQSQIQRHYDLGDDFYRLWLDKSMTYSCAYFRKPTETLEQAQTNKVDYILRKLQLAPGQSLLDIGSGWGQLMIMAAQKYGVTGLGITLSQHQFETATERAKRAGVDKQISFRLINYRDLAKEKLVFDRIVSVGMFEHVGRRNHASYFAAVNKMLVPAGISVLHTISNQIERGNDPWIDKYIFPGGCIPSAREVVNHLPEHGLRLLDYENLGIHYAMTLAEWRRRFEQHLPEITKMYDERFVRTWRFYLCGAEAGFRFADLDLSQFVFSKGINPDLPLTREFLYR